MKTPLSPLLIAFIVLGLAYSFVTPILEGPDESGHYSYIRYLASGRGLPIQTVPPNPEITYQAHQPPLYYALGAALTFWIDVNNEADLFRQNPAFFLGTEPNLLFHTAGEEFPFRGASLVIHLVRILSVLFGAITVWGTYQLGKLLSGRKSVALGAAAVVALNPQFLFISGVMNNDNPLVAFVTLVLVVAVSMLIDGWTRKRAMWLGVWFGLALLSKSSALVLVPVVALTIIVIAWRERSWRTLGELIWWIGLPIMVISGWWFARNQILYGDLLGYRMYKAAFGHFGAWDFGRAESRQQYLLAMYQSFWGNFGWAKIKMNRTIYDLLAWLYLFAAIGALVGIAWRRQIGSPRRLMPKMAWFILVVTVLITMLWAIIFALEQGGTALQGRYLFPAIAAMAVLLVSGISAIVPDQLRWIPTVILVSGLGLLAVDVPGHYIVPKYRFFTLPESALATVPHPMHGTFSPEIALAGYAIQPEADAIDLTLYWRAQGTPPDNYKVYVHAFNPDNQLCGQHDALPLNGAFLMTYWRAGDLIEDVHTVPIKADCCPIRSCRLNVGLYREDTGERLLYSLNGKPISDHVEIEP